MKILTLAFALLLAFPIQIYFVPSLVNICINTSERPYKCTIEKYAIKYNVDRKLIRAIIRQESQFDPEAESKRGAYGLMQLMPSIARKYKVNRYTIDGNIEGGTQHLKYLLDKYDGNIELTLASYNAGESNVRKYKGVPPFPETKTFIAKVKREYNFLGGDQWD